MIEAIKRFFTQHIAAEQPGAEDAEHRLQLATAALMVEMTRADFRQEDVEFEAIHRAIRHSFALSDAETTELIALAEQEAKNATSYYQFTSLINQNFSYEQKLQVIEHLWRVAFADEHMDKYEEHLVRKIAELLYIPHRDFIAAKHRAQQSR